MSMFFTIAVIVLVFLVIFQIAKAGEYVSVLKGEEKSFRQHNKINGFLMISFLIFGLIGVYWCNSLYYPKTLFPQGSASVQGERVDSMFMATIAITGIVFFITQIALFWFAFKYQASDKRKTYYFTHNNTMELIWTVVPAIALTVLVVIGLRNWFSFTGEAPQNAMQVEITGKQFNWIYRYPGDDKVFGKKYYKMIDEAGGNMLGLLWKDSTALNVKADPNGNDDIITTEAMYVVKDKPVKLIIGSRDVIHDVGLSHFRMKMDAVPGIPTTMWFTPKYTTKEMKERTNNPNFEYEISCDQMCGNGHYSMRGLIKVVTQEEFDVWMAKQKPAYYGAFPDKDPSAQKSPIAVTDTTKKTAAITVATTGKKAKL
jgi:cytochrome c oxidase subunit II